MKKFGIVFFVWLVWLMPFRMMYFLSDILYLIGYNIVGYRKKVVLKNIRNSFPKKNEKEIISIAKQFYHHFFDVMLEVPKSFKISEKRMEERFHLKNPEILDKYYEQKKSVIFITGHYGNWEWLSYTLSTLRHKGYAVYLPLRDKKMDDFLLSTRQRFGTTMVSNDKVIRSMMSNFKNGALTATYFLADQSPHRTKIQHWIRFLNQDTPVFVGVEKIARKLNNPTFFLHIQKVKRGYYELELKLLHENPKDLKEFELTQMQMGALEQIINEQPQYWLWSHKRWKHKKHDTPLQSELVKTRETKN